MEGRNVSFYINRLLEETDNEVFGGESSDDEPENLEVIDHGSLNIDVGSEDEFVNDDVVEEVMGIDNIGGAIYHISGEGSDSGLGEDYADQCRIDLNIDQYCSDDDKLPYGKRIRTYCGKVIEPGIKWFRKPPPLGT